MIEVYKASAGAGKTHRLTGEYIELLFAQPYAFKHILAVTFTNKATDEMKQRILQQLHLLSQPGAKSDYLQRIMVYTGKDENWVRSTAKEILISILHDYTSFRVSTIDRFFQLVMRSFARELGRMATYNVELDRDSVLTRAVDKMFAQLDEPQNQRLLDWLIEYSLDAVDKGSSWNIKGEILKLGNQLFSEEFKLAKEKANTHFDDIGIEDVALLKASLKKTVDHFEGELTQFVKDALGTIESAGMQLSDFKGGSRSPMNYLKKAVSSKGGVVPPTATFIALRDGKDKWFTGKKCPNGIEVVYPVLNVIVGKIIDLFEDSYREYATAIALLSNINVLGILNDIYAKVVEYCREKNIILLSESTELLNRIIDGSDTPFIYEKIGVQLDHYMLDEFQDTSSLQWRNFYPLLNNSIDNGIAGGNKNLIVGDEKQSIYRWRGSNWKILKEDLYSQFRKGDIKQEELEFNYRSGKNIVDFNNVFFKFCSSVAQGICDENGKDIIQMYGGEYQKVPDSGKENPGYVEVSFLREDEQKTFYEQALEALPEKVGKLIDGGYSKKDIAVLVRTGREGNMVAEKLIECGYDIISSDSLYICSSKGVQKVVNVLREADNPNNDSLRILRMFQHIPPFENIGNYSLYQLCEAIIRESLTQDEQEDMAYLQGFLDLVLEFTNTKGSNIAQFVKWWDESGVKCTISAPDDMDAIKVMTIHKSKGLGFNVVIIPFLKEDLDHKPLMPPTLWCNYNGMPVPVKYVKALAETNFEKEYRWEKLCACIDALNTVYVAFTRAKKEMVVLAPEPSLLKSGDYALSAVSDILYRFCNSASGDNWNNVYTIGESGCTTFDKDTSGKLFLKGVFSSPLQDNRIKTAAQSGSLQGGESIREHGIAMHYVFSLVDYVHSVPDAVARACKEGVANCSEQELLDMVTAKIKSVENYGWFNTSWKVLNECSILTADGEEKRPDRVLVNGTNAIIIDYKFGAFAQEDTQQLNRYKKQVSRYMDLLTGMGFKNVEGYLWYISADEIISV